MHVKWVSTIKVIELWSRSQEENMSVCHKPILAWMGILIQIGYIYRMCYE